MDKFFVLPELIIKLKFDKVLEPSYFLFYSISLKNRKSKINRIIISYQKNYYFFFFFLIFTFLINLSFF
jgi:hypothetical protein